MTNKEKEMYALLRANPSMSQAELAKRMNITRSSASVHVSNLIKKGYITGRGYIFGEPGYVAIVGAANIDIVGRSTDALVPEDSNPGHIETCAGGVGRNIGENLARLGVSVKMISSLGDDAFAARIVQISEDAGMDMSHSYVQPGGRTSTYLAILDNNGEMNMALSDMHMLDILPVEHLAKKHQVIANSDILVIDSGLIESTVDYILANFGDCRIFLDPVSLGKAKHIQRRIGAFDTIKANRLEAEFLSGIAVQDDDGLRRCGDYFMKQGVNRLFISLGARGLYYRTADEENIAPTIHITPVNATGAGDALMAGIVYGTLQGMSCEEIAHFGSAMARIALMSESTVSPLMSLANVHYEVEQQSKQLKEQ